MKKFNYSYVTLDEGNSSQYNSETFQPGKAVEARYVRSVNNCDNGNPFIEALPLPRETVSELRKAYEIGIPGYKNNIQKSRTFCLRELPLLENVRFKLNFQDHLELEHYNCLVESYRHREFLLGAQTGCKVIGRSVGATTKGYTLVGKSGSGKSAALETLLRHYPQVINHSFEGIGEFKQITYLMVNAIPNDNFKAFYQAIGKAVDQALGFTEPLYELQVSKAKNLGEKALVIEHLIELFAIGIIIVDEIELMSFSFSKENSFTGLARLSNETKVCFVLCGLDTSVKKWNSQEWMLRRSGAQIHADMYCNDRGSFDIIMAKLLRYNWLKKPLTLSEAVLDEFYFQTGGIICYIILLYERLQFDLLNEENPVVTPEYIQTLMKTYFPELQKIKEQQSSTKQVAQEKEKILSGYNEALHSDIDAEIQEQAKRADEEEYLNKDDNTDYIDAYINYVLKILKLLPDYSTYNEATIRHNIDLVLKKMQNKDIELNQDYLLTATCKELKKKHTDKKPRRKKESVPAVPQIQNHLV